MNTDPDHKLVYANLELRAVIAQSDFRNYSVQFGRDCILEMARKLKEGVPAMQIIGEFRRLGIPLLHEATPAGAPIISTDDAKD